MAVCHMCRWVSIIPGMRIPPAASTSRVPSGRTCLASSMVTIVPRRKTSGRPGSSPCAPIPCPPWSRGEPNAGWRGTPGPVPPSRPAWPSAGKELAQHVAEDPPVAVVGLLGRGVDAHGGPEGPGAAPLVHLHRDLLGEGAPAPQAGDGVDLLPGEPESGG